MAIQQNTVEYWFPSIAAVTDNTDTNFGQITINLPENGKVFRSVFLEVMIQDAEATANNVSRRQISLQIGASGYTVVNNTNLLTASGEQKWIMATGDFTFLFDGSWSGSSMTCDARCLFDSALGTSVQHWRSATAKLVITYDYDEATSPTRAKTVRYGLTVPIANLATTKPGTANDTIPALDTWLEESGKTISQINLTIQGNEQLAVTTDRSISWGIDSGSSTSPLHEGALNTSVWFRESEIQTFTTSASHSFYIWASVAGFPSVQAYLTINYTYNEAASTRITNSLLLPMEFDSPGGGPTSNDYQRASRALWIQEPGTITIKRSSFFLYWDQSAQVTGIQMRVNAGAWSGALANNAGTVAGGAGASLTCDGYMTLDRGYNELQADVFRTDTTDYMYNLSAIWIINYSSDKHVNGSGNHNRTVIHSIQTTGTYAAIGLEILTGKSISLPNAEFFINALGIEFTYLSNSTGVLKGVSIQVERLPAEGGVKWESIYLDLGDTDSLVGIRRCYSQARSIFKRFPDDYDSDRLDIQVQRRYRDSFTPAVGWSNLCVFCTYHSITYSISGNISASAGGSVILRLFSEFDKEFKKSVNRTGDGSYSFTWYDNTNMVWVDAYENDTHLARSAKGYAS